MIRIRPISVSTSFYILVRRTFTDDSTSSSGPVTDLEKKISTFSTSSIFKIDSNKNLTHLKFRIKMELLTAFEKNTHAVLTLVKMPFSGPRKMNGTGNGIEEGAF